MENSIKKSEQKHLDFVESKIEMAEVDAAKKIKKAKGDQSEIQKNFFNDVRLKTSTYSGQMETGVSVRQQQQLLSERENRWKNAARDLGTLKRLDQNPYFARIDFHEEGEKHTETIYIGLASFTDNPDDYLVYDWRAPISSIYYDSGIGQMTYDSPAGPQKVDVKLKRQIEIKDGKIETIFDTDEALGDNLLLENLSHQSDTKMKSIVTTIQKEQNQIIRDTDSDLLFVQGAAGSGKTAAVLQRIAYLLYRYRGNLNSGQVILFSPNQLFNDYINEVLPELGEQNMVQMTYYQYTNRRVPHLSVETVGERFTETHEKHQQKVVDFKNSLDFFKLVGKYAHHLNKENFQFKDIKFEQNVFISKEEISEIYYRFNQNYNLRNRLEATKEELSKILNRHIGSEMRKKWVEETIEGLDQQQLQAIYAKFGESMDNPDKEYNFLAKKIVQNAFRNVKKAITRGRFVSINRQFVNLLRNVPRIADLSKYGISEQEWNDGVEKSIDRLKNGKISDADISIYLYLYDLISGKRPDVHMRYLFVDEVQDYTPFQLAYLKFNFPRAKFTLLGDLNQAIFTHESSQSLLKEMETMFDPEKTRVIELNKSYRSTEQITDFTKHLIPDGSKIQSFARTGELPKINVVGDVDSGIDSLKETIQTNDQANDTTAIIAKSLDECKRVHEKLEQKGIKSTLIQTENQRLVKGVIVVPAYLAKGLEFDAVVMWNGSKQEYPTERDDQLVYTICSRAMHRLDVISIGELSPLFNDVPKDEYQLVTK
ncbi:RNA polymerase recycling motor HelD [Fructilactobacillus fructivorans]|uniref:DNA helicase n=1 Tax=Fructilactobacillus fructivorans TaxID=1614 RepID=A0A0C1LYQ6_9LACO|nr:RNA polymerase recycling motor HelD [Fructilactobacillus fructivorans]KID42020.1 DNA helicase [Fructilactobacillus fructivorans]MCT0151677.1 ATP-dependent DNA helicase [Fructilactobacillus fructivorans]MCT2867194.1 ATP-dependent DNA helicase [Fructilactobacillus fructivorans]MCT2868245.1 ATP-dependent DNA helicase [Fructilactobacillus fructivorans]MCT2872953.1 ATP-dependent DNA helicase [Fructilactobacillus fructivorans]